MATPPALQRIEQGVADVEPLGVTLRDTQVDLRTPTGFDGVYRLERTDPFGQREHMFMRIDGGITATFPQSVYTPTRDGLVPTIPPGTIFYLGDLPSNMQPEVLDRPRPRNFVDMSVYSRPTDHPAPERLVLAPTRHLQSESEALPAHVDGELPPPSIWTNEAYRKHRIAALLRRAAEGNEGRHTKPPDR